MRPLKRRVPSTHRHELDEHATAEAIADIGVLDVVLRPAQDRWLKLVLALDEGSSMRIWRDTIRELIHVLTVSGIFGAVRTCSLDTTPGITGSRTVVLVVTDGVADHWHDGSAHGRLAGMAKAVPTAVLNLLPMRLWSNTALSPEPMHVRTTAPVQPNILINAYNPWLPAGLEPRPRLPVPVIELSEWGLRPWAELLASHGGVASLRIIDAGADPRSSPPHSVASHHSAEQRVREFQGLVSPQAYELAGHLAAVDPLTLPVMRVVQSAALPGSHPSCLSEVLLSGLMHIDELLDGHEVFAFPPDVRSVLRTVVRTSAALRTIDAVNAFVEPLLGRSPDFPALIADRTGSLTLPRGGAPFTELGSMKPQRVRQSSDHRPYFFLSYAHTPRYGADVPDPDMWVERLFRDLCGHVMAMTDLPAGAPAGFMDREIRSGEGWSERLAEVLATCRVFVPLLSPRYFASEMCGKEWYAFAQREIFHQARSNRPAEAIVPALWVPVPPEQLPGPAEGLQFNHRAFGDRYVTDGLYGLIKLRKFAEEYERAVYELAKRIVSVADTTAVGPGRPLDFRQVPSAFGTPDRADPLSTGPRPIQITVVAPTLHDLPPGRDPQYYGDMPQDWNPYYPDVHRPLAYVARDLVRSLYYRATIVSFDHDSTPLDSKRAPTRPELLIVDRWALEDDERREQLAAFDAEDRPWVSVVVPFNRDDHQSRGAEGVLGAKLAETLPTKLGQGRAAACGVPSMEAFGLLLPQVVEAAAQQYLRHARVYPPNPSPSEGQMWPRLQGAPTSSGSDRGARETE